MRAVAVAVAVLAGLLAVAPAAAAPADTWFEQGLEADLGTNAAADPAQAFAWFLKAAQAGHEAAAFNVAVMLDSGRGVGRDTGRAATWYGRAAAHGNARAAYNLGQLYESGNGVPVNADAARAWYEASGLPAARERLARVPAPADRPKELSAPVARSPLAGDVLARSRGDIELVWTSVAQPEACRFTIEVRSIRPAGSEEIFSWTTSATAMLVTLPDEGGTFAWRVTTVGRRTGDYRAGPWQPFAVTR